MKKVLFLIALAALAYTFQDHIGQALKDRSRGYYREYTVPTPGSSNRGARRVVTGGNPPEVFYYTQDHYQSFRTIEGG